jgi:hypothetical protein
MVFKMYRLFEDDNTTPIFEEPIADGIEYFLTKGREYRYYWNDEKLFKIELSRPALAVFNNRDFSFLLKADI